MLQYDQKLAGILHESKTFAEVNGMKIQIKPVPDDAQPGRLDPREYDIRKREADFFANSGSKNWNELSVEEIRGMMGFPNLNMNTVEIITKYEELNIDGNTVGLWRYYPRKLEGKKDLPCFIFIHGGGWFGGSVYTVENPCKLIAERANCVVFNIDYSLAPEKPYPNAVNDCFGALGHIYENSEKYGVSKKKIGMGGDSAGGNLTAVCALKDRDLGTNMLVYEALIYPCVILSSDYPKGFEWRMEDFEIAEEHRALIEQGLSLGRPEKDEGAGFHTAYLQNDEDRKNPYVSPMLAPSLKGVCRTLIADAEFDGLRVQDELYGKMLKDAGVDTRVIRYRGVGHAYIDKLGVLPQAEDLVQEISDDILLYSGN